MKPRVVLLVATLALVAACGDSGVPNAPAVPTTLPNVPSEPAEPLPNVPSEPAVPTTLPNVPSEPAEPLPNVPSEPAVPTTAPSRVPPTTSASLPIAFPDDPLPAFLAWLEAVHTGDVATALMLTGPFTSDSIDEEQAVAIHAELEEGWGAWHVAVDREIDVSDVDAAALISMRGTVSQEGFTQTRAVAMPMIKDLDDGGNWKVEWLPGGGGLSWQAVDQQVCATGPATFGQRLYVDGTEQSPQFELNDQGDPMVAVCFTLADANVHTVSVVFLSELASVYSASAYLYPTGP